MDLGSHSDAKILDRVSPISAALAELKYQKGFLLSLSDHFFARYICETQMYVYTVDFALAAHWLMGPTAYTVQITTAPNPIESLKLFPLERERHRREIENSWEKQKSAYLLSLTNESNMTTKI